MKVNDIIIKEGEVIAFRPREPYKRVPEKVRELAARWFWANEDYDQTGPDSKISLERLLRSRGYSIAFDDSKENIIIVHQNGSQYKFPVVDAYNYTGWHRDLFMESRYKFAGELVGQKPGDQVRGHEKAKSSKTQHPFKSRLVGTDENLENNPIDEASTTLQQSRATSQTMKTARNIDYSPALEKNVKAVILAAHQKLQLPHDLNWMNLPPLDGLVGMNIFTDENLRKIWAYHRDPNQYTGTMADKSKLASLAFLIKGPVGAVVMVATPDYNMRIPRKFTVSATFIDPFDGTLETVRDVTKTKILPVIKAATGKVNVRSGEILVADIRQKHTGKITQRQQQKQEIKKDTESTAVAYRKIYRLVPGLLQQVEADIMGNVQSLIKNKSYERAKQKIERLDTIRNLEDNITADSSNYYLMKANDLALYMTASHLFPDQTGEITRSYGGYGVDNYQGVERVVALIANNDRPTLGIFLAFFKRSLLLI